MNPHLLIVTIAVFYILVFGGLSILRREGLSSQFAFEVLGITLLVELGALLTNSVVNPVLFLILIYILSMRCRILVDIANLLSARGRQRDAIRILQLTLRLFPDRTSRLVVLVNMGIVQLRRQNPESARGIFETVLQEGEENGLGIKYEAACRFNLAQALIKLGHEAQAVHQYNEVIALLPNSIFSQAAERALERRRNKVRPVSETAQEAMKEDASQDESGQTPPSDEAGQPPNQDSND